MKYNYECSSCYQEAVFRSAFNAINCGYTANMIKAEINGDVLRDTDADPLCVGLTNNPQCQYIVPSTEPFQREYDTWNTPWAPPTHNIMSYASIINDCRTDFSPLQKTLMQYHVFNATGQSPNQPSFYANTTVDLYENDNTWQSASLMNFTGFQDICQIHTFHPQVLANGDHAASCDIDWIKIRVNQPNNYRIATLPTQVTNNIDTKLTLYQITSSGLATLSTNDNTNGSTVYSEIVEFLHPYPNYEYVVKIESLNGGAGDYEICMDLPWGLVTEDLGNEIFSISPNPATNNVSIDILTEQGVSETIIFDQNGVIKYQAALDVPVHNMSIDVSTFIQGMHYVYVNIDNNWYSKALQIID